MADLSNLEQLRRALGIYVGAMQDLIHSRLKAAYGGPWFKEGVLPRLDDKSLDQVKKAVATKNITKPAEMAQTLEPQMIKSVVLWELKGAFAGFYTNYAQTQAYLTQTVNARNLAMHQYTGDIPDDDAAEGVRAMLKLLQQAKRPEAAELEAIWKQLTGVGQLPADVAAPAAVAPVSPPVAAPVAVATPLPLQETEPPPAPAPAAPSGALPCWWQVTEPWDAYQDPAAIDIAQFAATLGGVAAGTARTEYLNPVAFFSRTYFTEDVKAMVRDILARMNGGDGESAIEMQTPFGGGKTHALLVLYHLINNPEESLAVPGVHEALGDVTVPAGARVAVIDGTLMGTEPVNKEDGSTVNTLWGEIAHQLSVAAFREAISSSDHKRVAPGNTIYRKVLEAASPCLILVDELVSYLVKLKAGNRADEKLYEQTVQFLQELLQLAGDVPGVSVLVSFPQSQIEFGGLNPSQLMQQLGIADVLRARADRVVSKRVPVSDKELYLLMSRRLFKPAVRAKVNEALDAYYAIYERDREKYPPEIFSSDYRRQMADAYPLHPELIDVLYKKWGAQGNFPRTRTVLQLLAQVISNEWRRKRKAHLIQSAHVDLERERVRTRVLAALGASVANDAVIARDIIGGDAHADNFDERLNGRYRELGIARGVATSLLLHSAGGRAHEGAMPWDLYLGTVSPDLGPEYVDEVLHELEQTLWHVHRDGQLLRFETKQNLYRRIAETALNQPPHAVEEAIKEAMAKAYGVADGFRVLQWAAPDGTIPDQPEPSIAVLAAVPRYRIADENGQPSDASRKAIEEIWSRSGGGFRQWRNALVLIAPDRDAWERAEQAMREVLAYDAVLKGSGAQELSDRERQDLQSRRKDKQDSLRTSLVTAYRWVFYPSETKQGEGLLEAVSLPSATSTDTIAARALARLESADYGSPKVLRKMSAMYFDAKFAPRLWKDDEELDLAEMSRRFPAWTYLPILPDRERTLRDCIRDGLTNKTWAVVYGNKDASTFRKLVEKPAELDAMPALFDGTSFLVRGQLLQLIREELAPKGETATPAPEPGREPEAESGTLAEAPARGPATPQIAKRHARVRVRLPALDVAKSQNLQPYLWKVIQATDASSKLSLSVDITCPAGISEDVLRGQIVEAFEMLNIPIEWEPL